jgi:hypothetical protein
MQPACLIGWARQRRNRSCPRPAWMGGPGSSSCWSATARTWSPSGPGSRTGCAGTCVTWIPSGRPPSPPGIWSSGRVLDELEAWLTALPDSVQVGIVQELVGRCRELTQLARELQAELSHRVARVCPRLLGAPYPAGLARIQR